MAEVVPIAGGEMPSNYIEPAPPYSEEALALEFAAVYEGELCFVAAWNKWFCFDGMVWREDDTLAVIDMAREICRRQANMAEKGQRQIIASSGFVYSVVKLARTDRRLAGTVDQWDANPMWLNTPAGVVNLENGANYGFHPEFYLTKITAAAPGGDCPLWHSFLDRITGGDDELVQYLQRLFGYCLTGSTSAHALAFFYGTGANGKSVTLSTMASIIGGYAATAPIETFTASNSDRHPTDIAGLRGARLVTAVETEEGRAWAEAKIKSLTGGDKISARFMRQDFFEFVPQFKLVIAGNHKPSLRSVDEATRRRFNLVPFQITIPPQERDPDLAEKLKAEWPGILDWAITGCLQWQRHGLMPPAAVTAATAAYLTAEDSIATWIAERCLVGNAHSEKSSRLFASWKDWAAAAGEQPGTQKRFSQALETRGLVVQHTRTGNSFGGIAVAAEMTGWP